MASSSSGVKIFTRLELFSLMQRQDLASFAEKLEFMENYLLKYDNYEEEEMKKIKHQFSYQKSEFKRRWLAAQKKSDLFVKKNEDWLLGSFTLPITNCKKRSGRPTISFSESSDRSKRRKTEDLRKNTDLDVLTYATKMKLYEEGKRNASKVVKDLINSPSKAIEYRTSNSKMMETNVKQLSALKSLSMIVEGNFTRNQYEVVRSTNKPYYPCYTIIQREKKEAYPDESSYLVTETCAEIKLQYLMDLTVKRFLIYLIDVLQGLEQEECNTLRLICKWGCDGSQQNKYKQTFVNTEDSDASIFQSSFVPLQLICDHNNKVIWQNPTPSSPRYCRPIRIRFVKESVDIINAEISHVQNSAALLEETKIRFKKKLGLLVDVPKHGFGNTNDGNTSRRFFSEPVIASEILGIDQNLIYRLKIILETICSGHKIDCTKFSDYTIETAKLYINLYPWYPMSPTVHKILIHGAIVIEKALLPIGQLSEEAGEARNKHFRLYRDNFSRKFSRTACNLDVLNRLLLTSDPLLTGMRPCPRKKSLPFSKETQDMLLSAEPFSNNSANNDDECDDDHDNEIADLVENEVEDEDL